MSNALRVLMLEDSPNDAELVARELRRFGVDFDSIRVEDRDAFVKAIDEFAPDIILADYKLPAFDGAEALKISLRKCPQVPFLFVTGTLGEENAVEMLKQGATDYVLKDHLSRLGPSFARAIDESNERRKRRQAEEHIAQLKDFYAAILDSVVTGVWVTDRHDTIGYVNRSVAAIMGIQIDELLGKHLLRDFSEHPLFVRHYLEAKQQLAPLYYDATPIRTPSGRDAYLSGWLVPQLKNGEFDAMICTVEDITERKLVADELKKSADEIADLYERAPCGYHSLDRFGRLLRVNQTELSWLGYSREELVGNKGFADLLTAESRRNFSRDFPLLIESGEAHDLEYEMLRKDGSVMPVLLNAIAETDSDGNFVAARSTIHDISERRASEMARRRLVSVVEFSNDAIIGQALDGTITSWNLGAEKIYGYAAAEIVGQSISVLAPAGRVSELEEFLERVRRGQSIIHHETQRLRKGGALIDVSLTLSPILDAEGNVTAISTIAQDISDRKQAERALKASAISLAQAQKIARLGNWDWDLLANRVSWSDETYVIFGIEQAGFEATYPFLLQRIPEGDRELFANSVAKALQGEKRFGLDHRIALPDGGVRFVHSEGEVTFDAAHQAVSLQATIQDITERKITERALRKLNRALKTLSNCNETLVHASEENQLLQDMCRIIVEVGENQAAWVGFKVDDESRSVRPMAQYGLEPGYLENAGISWGETGRPSPVKATILSGQFQVIGDVNDPAVAIWREDLIRHEMNSILTLPLFEQNRVFGTLCILSAEKNAFGEDEIKLLGELASDLAFGILTLRTRAERAQAQSMLGKSMEGTIQAVAATVEMRDPYTAGHQRRVAQLARLIALELGLSEQTAHGIHLAGIVHDLGKINIPAEILSRPGQLSEIEYTLIKTHAQAGFEILKEIEFPWPIAQMVHEHHERLDGSGYPAGLRGDEILFEARILAVADVVEAMTSHRPYRPGLGLEKALEEIGQFRGIRYDAKVVDSCLKLFREKGFVFGN